MKNADCNPDSRAENSAPSTQINEAALQPARTSPSQTPVMGKPKELTEQEIRLQKRVIELENEANLITALSRVSAETAQRAFAFYGFTPEPLNAPIRVLPRPQIIYAGNETEESWIEEGIQKGYKPYPYNITFDEWKLIQEVNGYSTGVDKTLEKK